MLWTAFSAPSPAEMFDMFLFSTSRRRAWGRIQLLCAVAFVASLGLSNVALTDEREQLLGRIKGAVDLGSRWIAQRQNPDGGYGPYGDGPYVRVKNTSDLGLTTFALYALARNPRDYTEADGPYISAAVDFILARQRQSGAFFDLKDPTLPNYKTSVAILALVELDRAKYADAITRAREYVRGLQFGPAAGYDPKRHLHFGGFGYGSGLRGDLSNTQFALDALVASGLSPSDELWTHVQPYLRLCLNRPGDVDPRLGAKGIGSTGDGGARYSPNTTRGPIETLDGGVRVFSSYGSMSYAALKSFLHARVERSDPDFRRLVEWISRNYSIDLNPGMATARNPSAGLHGLFYYYHTMAKALRLYGETTIKDAKGEPRDWAAELSAKLIGMQASDGSWVNTSDRWMENLPLLDTSYALISLVECYDQIKADLARASSASTPSKK